jgi:hypothetical protein
LQRHIQLRARDLKMKKHIRFWVDVTLVVVENERLVLGAEEVESGLERVGG